MAGFLETAIIRRDVLMGIILRTKGYTESERLSTATYFELNERTENLRSAYETLSHIQMDIMAAVDNDERVEQQRIYMDAEEIYVQAMSALRERMHSFMQPPSMQPPMFFAYAPSISSQNSAIATAQEQYDLESSSQVEQEQPCDDSMPTLVPFNSAADTSNNTERNDTQVESSAENEIEQTLIEQTTSAEPTQRTTSTPKDEPMKDTSKGAIPKESNEKPKLTATIAPEGGTVKWKRLEEEAEQLRESMHDATKALISFAHIRLTQCAESYDAVITTLQRAASTMAIARANLQGFERLLAHLVVAKLPISVYKNWPIDYDDDDTPSLLVVEGLLLRELETSKKASAQSEVNSSRAGTPEVSHRPIACHNCGQAHTIFRCPDFLALKKPLRKLRATELRLCLNCFSMTHHTGSAHCRSGPCKHCKVPHNSLLCEHEINRTPAGADPSEQPEE